MALLAAASIYATGALGHTMVAKVCEPMVLLVEGDNGRTLDLRTGESIKIVLPENATTGYRWSIDHYDKELFEEVAQEPRYTSPAIGSGGEITFIFKAKKTGRGEIVLKHGRRWAGEASVTKHFRIHLNVKP